MPKISNLPNIGSLAGAKIVASDSTGDAVNIPITSLALSDGVVETLVQGTGVTVNSTDPQNPIVAVDTDAVVVAARTTTSGLSFVLDEDDMASNSATKLPTQQSVKAYANPAIRRSRETVSVVEAMAPSLADAILARDATSADASDIYEAIQDIASDCVDRGRALYVPAGLYFLDEQVVVDNPLTIQGASMGHSQLRWVSGASSSGLKIAVTDDPNTSIVCDLALETLGVAAGTALEFDYSGLIDGGFIMPRARSHARVSRVNIRGATGYTTDGWEKGIDFVSCLSVTVDESRLNGVYTGAYGSTPNSDEGITFGGGGAPTSIVIDKTWLSAWKIALLSNDAEGIYVNNCELVTVSTGVKCDNAAIESALALTNSHIAALEVGVDLTEMAEFWVSSNSFYSVADTAELVCVWLRDGCRLGHITRNNFRRLGSATEMRAIYDDGCDGVVIDGNIFDVGASGQQIELTANSENANVGPQSYISGPSTPIVDASTGATFAEFFGYAGDLNDITSSGKRARQMHTLATGCTNKPSEVSNTVGCVVITDAVDANTAHQVLEHPNGTINYARRRTGGTWGAWGRVTAVQGSNANGRWVEHPDGTLICHHSLTITSVINSVVSSTWTFPKAAIDTTVQVFTNPVSSAPGSAFSTASSINATTAAINLRRNDSAVATSVNVMMVGRWK